MRSRSDRTDASRSAVLPERVRLAREVLDSLTLVEVTADVFEDAGRLDTSTSWSLDSIHLAAALHLSDDPEGLVTYDDRLAEAAIANGVAVVTPE